MLREQFNNDMKILFLDIDGVLWGYDWVEEAKATGALERGKPFLTHMPQFPLSPKCIAILNLILDATECFVVVSSSWRCFMSEEELYNRLGTQGVVIHPERFLGFTPDLTRQNKTGLYTAPQRGDEIARWLADNEPDANYVIIDDDSDMRGVEDAFVKIDNRKGLTARDAVSVICKFNGWQIAE